MSHEEEAQAYLKNAENRAVNLLSRREHSAHELAQKLRQRGFANEVIAKVLEKLQDNNWQSDTRFTASFVRSRISQHKGPNRIYAELNQKGITQEMAELAIEDEAVDWVKLAVELLVRKYPGPCLKIPTELAKRQRFLAQRGFTSSQVYRAIDQVESSDFTGWDTIF